MHNSPALAEQLLDYLQSKPELPEYLEGEPELLESFDPYQMVGEWIALRQEIKQQNKLFQSSQAALQQALETERSRNEQLQDQLQNQLQDQLHHQSQSQTPSTPKPEEDLNLLKDLLPVMDALDQAIAHCQSQIAQIPDRVISQPHRSPNFRQKVCSLFQPSSSSVQQDHDLRNKSLIDSLSGNQEGIELIRRSLLALLQQRKITPILSLGQPFDPTCMYAIAQQSSDTYPTNAVLQEIVRGYKRGDRILREAQVIVANRAQSL